MLDSKGMFPKDGEDRPELLDYLIKSFKDVIFGSFSDESTLLSIALNIISGWVGGDLPMDLRDIAADVIKLIEFGSKKETWLDLLLNTIAFLPVIGSIKYIDEAVDIANPVVKNYDEAAEIAKKALKNSDEAADVGKAIIKSGDEAADVGKEVVKNSHKIVNGYEAKINIGQQNKHIPGTNEYKISISNEKHRSIMYGTLEDMQKLLDDKAGTGEFLPGIKNRERVNFGKTIGLYIDSETNVSSETTIGIIHYGKKGAHIVPARPTKK